MMNPRLYTTSYNKPQGQQFDTAVLSFIKLQYTEKSCKMINIFVLVTILGHLPVILFAKRKGSEDMKQILIVEDDSFLNKMLAYNLTADGYQHVSSCFFLRQPQPLQKRKCWFFGNQPDIFLRRHIINQVVALKDKGNILFPVSC